MKEVKGSKNKSSTKAKGRWVVNQLRLVYYIASDSCLRQIECGMYILSLNKFLCPDRVSNSGPYDSQPPPNPLHHSPFARQRCFYHYTSKRVNFKIVPLLEITLDNCYKDSTYTWRLLTNGIINGISQRVCSIVQLLNQ